MLHSPFPKLHACATAAALMCAAAAGSAQAALTENYAISIEASALGHAVTADPPGISSIHFNPAGLTHLSGTMFQQNVIAVTEQAFASFHQPANYDIAGFTQDPLDGRGSMSHDHAFYVPGYGVLKPGLKVPIVPSMGFSWTSPDGRFTFGTAVYTPQAVFYDRSRDPNDPARFDGKTLIVQRLTYLSPTVAWKATDTLSFGIGIPISHQAFAIDTDFRTPNKLIGIIGDLQKGFCPSDGGSNVVDTFLFGICGGGSDGRLSPYKTVANIKMQGTVPFDPTINLGVLWEPRDWFALGAVYQSGSNAKLTGNYEINTGPELVSFIKGLNSSLLGPILGAILGFPQSIPVTQKGNLTLKVPFPAHFQVGMKIKPVDRVQLNVDAMWTDWAKWGNLEFDFDKDIELLKVARLFGQPDPSKLIVPRGYKSVWNFGFGMQVKTTDKLTLLFGYEPRKSSVPTDKIDVLTPVPSLKAYSAGAKYQADKDTQYSIVGSYSLGKFDAPANSSCNLNCTNLLNLVYNPYAGLDVSGGIKIRFVGFSMLKRF